VNKKSLLSRASRSLCLLIMSLIICVAVALSGCTKEKATGPKVVGSAGTCEVLDKLPKEVAKPLEINYAVAIKLLGITVNKGSRDKLTVSYYWQPHDSLEGYNTVFVHFTNKNNQILFQNDHRFCPQRPFKELKGKVVKETFNVDFPQSAVGQEIFVKIGLYDPQGGGRLKIMSANGIRTDDSNSRAIVENLKL
jgi:hypothetical protein